MKIFGHTFSRIYNLIAALDDGAQGGVALTSSSGGVSLVFPWRTERLTISYCTFELLYVETACTSTYRSFLFQVGYLLLAWIFHKQALCPLRSEFRPWASRLKQFGVQSDP